MTNDSNIQDFFSLLGLPVACGVDAQLLEANYKRLQSEFHPDRHAGAEAPRRLAAMQQASLLNDAYTTLQQPLKRAEHLLQLRGVDTGVHSQADMDPAFLLDQMEFREELETAVAAQAPDSLVALQGRAEAALATVWQQFTEAFDNGHYQAAKAVFHKLQFWHRLIAAIREAEERLLDY